MTERLQAALKGEDEDEDSFLGSAEDIGKLVSEALGNEPLSLRLVSLLHVLEYMGLKSDPYPDTKALGAALTRPCLPERAILTACRCSLEDCMALVDDFTSETAPAKIEAKTLALKRLLKDWGIRPSEEHLSLLHLLPLEQQVHTLLCIERKVEQQWVYFRQNTNEEHGLLTKNQWQDSLDMTTLLAPFLAGAETEFESKLLVESGYPLTVMELAKVKAKVADLLGSIFNEHQWEPQERTWKREKTLGQRPTTLPQDMHLETHRTLATKEMSHCLHIESILGGTCFCRTFGRLFVACSVLDLFHVVA
eukprot:1610983-Amphidinium_carterae.1